jgi:hypothetical protein
LELSTYINGSYNVICDRCGFKYKHFELRKEWTGLMVCNKCWETRHPQDFVRGVADQQAVPISRPESTDVFLCSSSSGVAGRAIAGCALPNN